MSIKLASLRLIKGAYAKQPIPRDTQQAWKKKQLVERMRKAAQQPPAAPTTGETP